MLDIGGSGCEVHSEMNRTVARLPPSPTRMRAAVTAAYGSPSYTTGTVPVSRPREDSLRPGELLVRVAVASLTPVDAQLRAGALRHTHPLPLPAILGSDFAGTIVAVGPEEVSSNSNSANSYLGFHSKDSREYRHSVDSDIKLSRSEGLSLDSTDSSDSSDSKDPAPISGPSSEYPHHYHFEAKIAKRLGHLTSHGHRDLVHRDDLSCKEDQIVQRLADSFEYTVGTRVFGRARPRSGQGACAEYIVVHRSRVAPIPSNMSFSEAAALPAASCAAYAALVTHAKLQANETVLVWGAASAEGHVAAQMAKALGAGKVIAVCCAKDKRWVTRLLRGCDIEVRDIAEDTPAKLVTAVEPDVVLDCEGNASYWDAVRAHCSAKTRFVAYGTRDSGMMAATYGHVPPACRAVHGSTSGAHGVGEEVGRLAVFSARCMMRKAVGMVGMSPSFSIATSTSIEDLSLFTDVAPVLERGKVKVRIDKKFKLDQASAAHALMDSGKLKGKVAISMNEECHQDSGPASL